MLLTSEAAHRAPTVHSPPRKEQIRRLALLVLACLLPVPAFSEARLQRVHGYRIVRLEGTPEQMGEQHGRLLRSEVRRMIRDLVGDASAEQLRKAMVMERHLPERYRRELAALARSAGVDYEKLVLAQLFGDVARAWLCTSFAAFGPATRSGECIVGRNFDYWDSGVSAYGAVIVDYAPEDLHRFITITWAGIINGWTLMNEHGIVAANNTGGGRDSSLEGISTCFMLRCVAEQADSVEEGIELVRAAPRACGTILLIAGGEPPDAAIVEYDHAAMAVRPAEDAVVAAANSFRKLYREEPLGDEQFGRYATLMGLIHDNYGRIDRSMNLIGAPGVPIEGINLHSVMLFPRDLTFAVSMGEIPACKQPYRWFRMTPDGVVGAEGSTRRPADPPEADGRGTP